MKEKVASSSYGTAARIFNACMDWLIDRPLWQLKLAGLVVTACVLIRVSR